MRSQPIRNYRETDFPGVTERRLCTFTPAPSRTKHLVLATSAVLGEPSLVETLVLGHPGAELVVINTRLSTINSGINEEDGRTKGRSIRISDAAIFCAVCEPHRGRTE